MSYLDDLRPASFRGAAFFIDSHEFSGGRRLAPHEFPLRDRPSVEDMGQRQGRYRLRAYVLADQDSQSYFSVRDALATACSAPGSGTLVHPYLGRLTVYCADITLSESAAYGGMATFDLVFLDAGAPASPTVRQDTAASLLSGITGVLSIAVKVYAIGSLIASRPSVLLGLAEGLLGSYVASVLGLSPSVAFQLASIGRSLLGSLSGGGGAVTSALTGATGDPVSVAATDMAIGAAGLVAQPPSPLPTDSVAGQTATLSPMAADPSGGLAALATFGATPSGAAAIPVGLGAAQAAATQTQIIDLVRTAAVLAVAQIYANTTWTTAPAATAARTQLLGFLDERIAAAALAQQDDLYQAWLSLSGLAAADLVQRAQALPSLTTYRFPRGLPACVIAESLYQDGTRALELAALNAAPHPGFLPPTGLALSPDV